MAANAMMGMSFVQVSRYYFENRLVVTFFVHVCELTYLFLCVYLSIPLFI